MLVCVVVWLCVGGGDYFVSVWYDMRLLIGLIFGLVVLGCVVICMIFLNMMMNGEFVSMVFCSVL